MFLQNCTLITIKLFSMPGYVYLDILEWFVWQSLHKNGFFFGGGGGLCEIYIGILYQPSGDCYSFYIFKDVAEFNWDTKLQGIVFVFLYSTFRGVLRLPVCTYWSLLGR